MRLLMISNQTSPEGHAGFRDAYEEMARQGELSLFRCSTPCATAAMSSHEASLVSLMEEGQDTRPHVLLVTTPSEFGHDSTWVRRFLNACGNPAVIYWEGDAWHRWAKPTNVSVEAWCGAADLVFSTAREPQASLLRKRGAKEVRFIPHTYDHIAFAEAERTNPLGDAELEYDVVMIGNCAARWGCISRIPGAVQRADLVKRLQRLGEAKVAVYGRGWSGDGTGGFLPYGSQVSAIRRGLISANWDHFPRYESYASDRLPISLIAGRAHLTTAHRNFDWVPSEQAGLLLAPTVPALMERIREVIDTPTDTILALGAAAHKWARRRLSNREAARFMMGAVNSHYLEGLPTDPWRRLASDWTG